MLDLTGQRYGRLVFVRQFKKDNHNRWMWECLCDCGNTTVVLPNNVKNGSISSCGCLKKDLLHEKLYKHGIPGSHHLYRIWSSMKRRCNSPNTKEYAHYGGRGIYVCDEWMHDAKAFYDWSMANGWKEGLTLDRIDNDGPYCPDNCRWVTYKIQMNNKSNNIRIDWKGENHTLSEWSEIVGLNVETLKYRIEVGWPVDKAMTVPPRVTNRIL